jgi:hypothetical protein
MLAWGGGTVANLDCKITTLSWALGPVNVLLGTQTECYLKTDAHKFFLWQCEPLVHHGGAT